MSCRQESTPRPVEILSCNGSVIMLARSSLTVIEYHVSQRLWRCANDNDADGECEDHDEQQQQQQQKQQQQQQQQQRQQQVFPIIDSVEDHIVGDCLPLIKYHFRKVGLDCEMTSASLGASKNGWAYPNAQAMHTSGTIPISTRACTSTLLTIVSPVFTRD